MPVERNYILSHSTFKEICYLLRLDLSNCEILKTNTSQGGYPGGRIWLEVEGISTTAIAWYEIPPGDLNMFKVDGQWYAISLVASKTVSAEKRESRTGSYLDPDPRREIIWHYFDLSGYEYSLPLRFQNKL